MTLISNPERTSKIIEILLDWYYNKHDKLFKALLNDAGPPAGVKRGSDEHLLWITMTVSIDYQRNAKQLWQSGRDTWNDDQTRWVYYSSSVIEKDFETLQKALQKYKLSKKTTRDAKIWYTISQSFHNLYHGNPKELIKSCNFDALQLYYYMRSNSRKFPYLAGASGTSKILSLWIRLLHDEVGINFENLDKVPIPIDIHTARATITTGCLTGDFDGPYKNFVEMAQDSWIEVCSYLNNNKSKNSYFPLQLDEPLWNLSRLGCRFRENGSLCPCKEECELSEFCTANSLDAIINPNRDGWTSIKTKYPKNP